MTSFTRQRWIGLSLFLVLSALAIWLQARWFDAIPRLSFLSGWILFAVILALTFYNGRKKLPFLPLLSSEARWQLSMSLSCSAVFSGCSFRARFPSGLRRAAGKFCSSEYLRFAGSFRTAPKHWHSNRFRRPSPRP